MISIFSDKDRLCILIVVNYLLYLKYGIIKENNQYLFCFAWNTYVLIGFEGKKRQYESESDEYFDVNYRIGRNITIMSRLKTN